MKFREKSFLNITELNVYKNELKFLEKISGSYFRQIKIPSSYYIHFQNK